MSLRKNKIFKYEIEIKDGQYIDMPAGAQVLSAKEQNGKLCIWCLVDTRCSNKPKQIMIVGTGHDIHFDIGEYSLNFVDTVLMSNSLVFHVFA